MQINTCENEISTIEDASLLTKTTIGKQEININIRILWVLQEVHIRQIATDAKRSMIFCDKKKVMNKRLTRKS